MDSTDDRDEFGRFRRGTSGNPRGRPTGSVGLVEAIKVELDRADEDGRTMAERIAAKLVCMAAGGDVRAIQIVCDRVEGRPRAAQEDRLALGRVEFKRLEF